MFELLLRNKLDNSCKRISLFCSPDVYQTCVRCWRGCVLGTSWSDGDSYSLQRIHSWKSDPSQILICNNPIYSQSQYKSPALPHILDDFSSVYKNCTVPVHIRYIKQSSKWWIYSHDRMGNCINTDLAKDIHQMERIPYSTDFQWFWRLNWIMMELHKHYL